MQEKELSEKESLQLITQMIGRARNAYYESGLGMLLWGFANFISFGLAYLDWGIRVIHWPVNPFMLMLPVFAVHLYYSAKEHRKRRVKTYEEDIHDYVWGAFGICVLITTIIGGFAHLQYWVFPFLLLLFGFPTYVSGRILRFTPMIAGSLVCWALAIAAFFLSTPAHWRWNMLLVAFGALVVWIIPGFLLRARYLKAVREANV